MSEDLKKINGFAVATYLYFSRDEETPFPIRANYTSCRVNSRALRMKKQICYLQKWSPARVNKGIARTFCFFAFLLFHVCIFENSSYNNFPYYNI